VLQNIDPKFQSQVASSLKWLALSHQPLRPRELAEIFIIRPERAIAFDTAERLFNAEDVLKYLSSLVLAEKVWREDMEDRRDREGHLETCIRLAHFSIKEYLTSDRITEGPAARFAFSEADAHLHIALSCIAYHMQRSAADYSDHDGVQGFWLSAYAAHYWMAHMETVPRESWPQEVASAAAGALAVGSRSLSYILRKFDFRISNSESSVNPITDVMLRLPHCLTASLGYVQLTDMLISSHEYLTQEDLDAALVRAAHQGCTAVMELLLKKGADINAQDGEFGSPLQAAIRGLQPAAVEFLVGRGANVHHPPNHLGSVLTPTMDRDERWIHGRREARLKCLRTLLDSGADVNMSGGSARDDETPLHTAAQSVKDNLEQFHLLIERGANVNARGGKYGYPLQALCATDSPSKLVELLLDKGADINAVGGMYGTALQTSCNAGNIGVMELLLDRGADPNARGGCYETALQAACQGSWHFILDRAQLLVDRGADIHAQGGQYGNALQASCYGGNIDVVEWLLDLGADVNAPGGEYGSALQAGCSNGNIERVEIGLDLGADPNARGGRHTRPLKDALINFSSDFDLANLLVKWGADINAQGGEHGTALQASVYRGNFEMVEWLLDLGADVNASGSEYGSALQAAAAARFFLGDRGDDKRRMMQLLLSRGADVNQRGGKYGTALHAAVECQNADSVRLLLDHGADINAEDGEYGTALQTACARYDGEDIALFLLERGADVHIQGGRFGSAWHAVAKQWGDKWEEVMQLLLDRGVDINDARGRQHATALEAALTTAEWDKSLCPDKVRFLLDRGADVNVQAGQYGFPLQAACCRVVRLKAGHGNSVHIDYDNTTESVHAVQLLLDNCPGIDVNAQGGKFGTALQAAAYFGQASSVELLLREGADANLSGGKYGNALNAAVVSGWWNVVDVLLAAGATPDCWLRAEPDEEWFARVGEEEARAAVERYRVFWRKQKEKKGQASG
jgi:ankyrin repeat protein